jgi:phosphotransferase system HPr-like phosphotransfer protein
MGVLLLTATRGTEIAIRGEGDDAEELVQAIAALIEDNFGEEK